MFVLTGAFVWFCLFRRLKVQFLIVTHRTSVVGYHDLADTALLCFFIFQSNYLQYSSFIVHQNCMCFNGGLMHNK